MHNFKLLTVHKFLFSRLLSLFLSHKLQINTSCYELKYNCALYSYDVCYDKVRMKKLTVAVDKLDYNATLLRRRLGFL